MKIILSMLLPPKELVYLLIHTKEILSQRTRMTKKHSVSIEFQIE
jgi:hypothetical protein